MASEPVSVNHFDPVMLRRLEDLLEAKSGGSSNAEMFPFQTAVSTIQKLFRLSGPTTDEPSEVLFRTDLTSIQKQFVCAFFCRLLLARPETKDAEDGFTARLTQLVGHVAPREVYAGLNSKPQTHERWACLERLVNTTEKNLSESIASLKDLSSFGVFRQHFLQRFRPKAAQFLLIPFLPQSYAVDIRLNDLFNQVDNYLQETTAEKGQHFEKVKTGLEDLARDAHAIGTRYSIDYVGKLGVKLLELVRNDYENGPYAKPGEVDVVSTNKRYPLGEVGAKFNVSFVIRNKGPGLVSELEFELLDITGTQLTSSKLFLGELAPGERRVEIPTAVKKGQSEDLTGCGRVSWRQFDGTRRIEDFIVPLHNQRFSLDWEALSTRDPYALEPVSSESQLIGRKATLDQLLAQTRSAGVVSSLIIGQKRVGKTSIAKTFQAVASKELPETSVVYLESGDYINPDPARTVAELGRCITRAVVEQHSELLTLGEPSFDNSLAPLAQFLAEASKILRGSKFVFILDEFDELPLTLYKQSPVGDAMFLTIRSISGKPPYGFVLVGSEKLQSILTVQGEKLNKFIQLNVDYFDQEDEWSSYCDLVRKPVLGWLEIDDAAIVVIYKETAGNPFFTKLVCRELFKLMVNRHDAHVTTREAEEALAITIRVASSVNFQHFWDDGIFESGERKEQVSLQRRKLLIAFADSARSDGTVGKAILQQAATSYGVDEVTFEEFLREFVARNIWLMEEGFVLCKVALFAKWLCGSGVKTIITTMVDAETAVARRRQAEAYRINSSEIVQMASKLGMFKGMPTSEDKIRAWVEQFGPDLRRQRLMFRLLQEIRYYSVAAIRAKMREMHSRIGVEDLIGSAGRRRTDILVSYIDGAGKSGVHYARLYAEENNLHLGCIAEPRDIAERLRRGSISTLLFVDDIVATGETARRGLRKVLEEAKPELSAVGIPVILAAICVFDRARAHVENVGKEVGCDFTLLVGDILVESDRAFGDGSLIFDNESDRDVAKSIAKEVGHDLEPRCPLGYGDCQALVVFEASCPNNTLPIFWSRHNNWHALFPR